MMCYLFSTASEVANFKDNEVSFERRGVAAFQELRLISATVGLFQNG